jgi:hypothetical protein
MTEQEKNEILNEQPIEVQNVEQETKIEAAEIKETLKAENQVEEFNWILSAKKM